MSILESNVTVEKTDENYITFQNYDEIVASEDSLKLKV